MKYEKFHEMCDELGFSVYEEKPADITRERRKFTIGGVVLLEWYCNTITATIGRVKVHGVDSVVIDTNYPDLHYSEHMKLRNACGELLATIPTKTRRKQR